MTRDADDNGYEMNLRIDGALTSADVPPVHFPGSTWETDTAANLGLNQTNLDAFAAAVGGRGAIVRNGKIGKSWGDITAKFDWASAAKPVTAMMLFFAAEELDVSSQPLITGMDQLVGDFGWSLITKDETMTLAHLANMMSEYSRNGDPGEAWAYNDYAVQLFAETVYDHIFTGASPNAIVTHGTRLGSLQFQDGSVYGSRGGYGMNASCRDALRIGYFWLNKGRWGDNQLIPISYFNNFCKVLVPNALPTSGSQENLDYLGLGTFGGGTSQSGNLGPGVYGWGWWFNNFMNETATLLFPDAPTDLFMAQGHFGDETLVVLPTQQLVCACDGNWGNISTDRGTMNDLMALLADTVV